MLAASGTGSCSAAGRRSDNSVARPRVVRAAATQSGRPTRPPIAASQQRFKQQQSSQLVGAAPGCRAATGAAPRGAAVKAAAAAPAASASAAVALPATSEPQVEFLGVLDGMQTVRGVLEIDASPDLIYSILTDYDRCSEVFENISASQTIEEEGEKQVIQACSWRFLAFSGSFNVHLSVDEDDSTRSLVFRLVRSSFMRDFEGRWRVAPATTSSSSAADAAGSATHAEQHSHSPGSIMDGSGSSTSGAKRARIEHVLAVKPMMPIPAAVAPYTAGIFTRQVANILRDLQKEVEAKAAASQPVL